MVKEQEIIVAGHICIDLIPRFNIDRVENMATFFLPGKLINMREMVLSPGGPVSNTGLSLKKLGVNVGLMGKIGNDFLGNGLLSLLRQKDVDKGMIIVDGEMTSYTVAIVPPGIDRIFLHNPGANNTYCSEDVNYEEVGNGKIFHLGYPPLMRRLYENNGSELIKIFKKVKSLGVVTSLDMSLPDPDSEAGQVNWKGVLQNLLPYVDLFLPSAEESLFILNKDKFFQIKKEAVGRDPLNYYKIEDFEWLGEQFINYGARIVAIKSGCRGAYLKSASRKKMAEIEIMHTEQIENWADKELWGESFKPYQFGSATGSGDSFIAGFLAAFLRKCSIEDAVTIANCTGCQNVTEMDAISGIKTWNETLEMTRHTPHNLINITNSKWYRDIKTQLWVKRN